MAHPPRVIRNVIAEHMEFSAVRSADVPGFVDLCIDRGRGRLEAVHCLREEEVKGMQHAVELLQILRSGWMLARRDAIDRKLPEGLVCSGTNWTAVREKKSVFIYNREMPPKSIGKLPQVAEEVEILNAVALLAAGTLIDPDFKKKASI